MKAFAIASSDEWEGIKEEYKNCNVDCGNSPYGEYFILKEQNVLFYRSMARKAYSAAACQWFIDHFKINHLYVIGTCAGINTELEELEILQFKKCYQSDVVL